MISVTEMSFRRIFGKLPISGLGSLIVKADNATNEDEVLSEIWCSIHEWRDNYLNIMREKIVDAKKKISSS